MNINAFGTDNFLRYTIRSRLEKLGIDDRLIDSEGVESLSAAEITHACASRGIRTSNADPERLKTELAQWIDLHLHHNLSGVLLILSKAFSFTEKPDGTTDHLTSLKDTLSSLPDTLLNEAELRVSSDDQGFKQRLEVLQQQEELIEDEAEQEQEEEEARKARKAAEQEEKERLAAEQQELAAAIDAAVEKSKFDAEKARAKELLPESLAQETEEAKQDTKDVKMTTEQLSELGEALFILSAKSSVVRERQDLAKLMEDSQDVSTEASTTSASPAGEEGVEQPKPEPRKVSSLEKRVQKMLTEIDEQLSAYDKEVSAKLNTFELADGKISIANLRSAFEQIRHRPDDDTITALIDKLDVDHDGFVPLEDVTSLAEVEGCAHSMRSYTETILMSCSHSIGVVIDDAADQLLGRTQEIKVDEGLTSSKTPSTSAKVDQTPEKKKEQKLKREEIVE
jgi:LETM1 and EF-hand domain-containing protein 1